MKPTAAKTSSTPPTRPPRLFPGRVASTLILVCLGVMLIVRVFREEFAAVIKVFDSAAANISTMILSFVIVVTVAVWFLCFSDYAWRTKGTVMAALAALLLVLASGFQIDGPTGDLAFGLVPRPWLCAVLPAAPRPPAPKVADDHAQQGADLATTSDADFPRFLGPEGTNHLPSAGGAPLARDWNAVPPKLLWKQTIGQGWSGFAVVNGYAVTLEQQKDEEWVSCYEAATGKLIWKRVTPGRHEAPMGGVGPRSTPTIHKGLVYTVGGVGRLQCLDGRDGALKWEDDLLARCGTDAATDAQAVMWGRAGSPLVVADLGLLIVAGGGPDEAATSLLAYDLATGDVRWRGGNSQISYATPVDATLAGQRQIISVNENDVTGYDIQTGDVLWKHSWPGSSSGNASCSQPHVLAGDRILLSKGYGEGAEMIRIVKQEGKLAAESLWKNPRVLKTKFTNITIRGDYAYGLSDGVLQCVSLDDGKSRWRGGRYLHGQLLGVGDLILVLGEDGKLALVEANPERHVELGRIDALTGKTWNSFALYGKLLLIRNAQEAACYELPVVSSEHPERAPAANPPGSRAPQTAPAEEPSAEEAAP
ncbi:MAG TPA: PQQ-binding-like beta-propeller repeat protein [Pirellulaceae bacterium]|nr:PQQ-binding-like beta-propeller repeat protein [Pirellulaceae bacterium]